MSIPVIANGNIRNLKDIEECLAFTGADGVMSAVELLENPALFSGLKIPPCQLALEYLDFADKYPVDYGLIRGHLFKILKTV